MTRATQDHLTTQLGVSLAPAGPGEGPTLRGLLAGCDLPHQDIGPDLSGFLLARAGDAMVGSVGLEVLDHGHGLLRSLAVAPTWRSRGLGRLLCRAAVNRARQLGLRELWLLTTTAEGYFATLGFASVPRSECPPEVRRTVEFSTLCPATAACMWMRLAEPAPPTGARRDPG